MLKPKPPSPICFGANGTDAECIEPNDANQCTPGAAKKTAIVFSFDQYIEWTFDEVYYKRKKKSRGQHGFRLDIAVASRVCSRRFQAERGLQGHQERAGKVLARTAAHSYP